MQSTGRNLGYMRAALPDVASCQAPWVTGSAGPHGLGKVSSDRSEDLGLVLQLLSREREAQSQDIFFRHDTFQVPWKAVAHSGLALRTEGSWE